MKRILLIIILLTCVGLYSEMHFVQIRSIAVVPIQTIGLDVVTAKVSQSLLNQEILSQPSLKLIPFETTKELLKDESCTNEKDAVIFGKKLAADLVLITNFSKLGEKVLIQYILVDVQKETTILTDTLISQTVEDIDMVIKRLAISIDTGKKFDDTAEVGLITKYEEETPRRRKARSYGGGSFGYLFPFEGFGDDDEKSFLFDLRSGYEFERHEVGLLLGLRKGFASNIYYSYLLSQKDICPFIGGSVGFHWLTYKGSTIDATNGLELAFRTGIQFFRTYDFHILVNFEYAYTMNENYNQSVIFTLGLLTDFK